MDFKPCTDLMNALKKAGGLAASVVNMPYEIRESYRKVMENTYLSLNSALNMVITRLGDILNHDDPGYIVRETQLLDNWDEWMNVEREFRLCRTLQYTLREAETLPSKLGGAFSTRDWEALLTHMRDLIPNEGQLARVISEQFQNLASTAREAQNSITDFDRLKQNIRAFRDKLKEDRRILLDQENELLSLI